MKNIVVHFYDSNLSGAPSYDEAIENIRKPKQIIYTYDKNIPASVSIFSDNWIGAVQNSRTRYNVAWLMEPRALNSAPYDYVEKMIGSYDLILTYDNKLLTKYPEKSRYIVASAIYLPKKETIATHKKSKICSHIYSNKKQIQGHIIRHQIADMIRKQALNVDLYGSGAGVYLSNKIDGLSSYMFSIIVENNSSANYVTEKFYDCVAVKTVPIYFGDPNISLSFNQKGIINFSSVNELENILKNLNEQIYLEMAEAIEENHALAVNNHMSIDNYVGQILLEYFGEQIL